MLFVIRFSLLMLFKPLMNKTGYPIDVRHVILMSWGALRGALGIFLALLVEQEEKIDKKVKGLILYYSSVIAVFTLVMNATMTPMLVEKLKLSKETATSKKFMYLFLSKL
jgi:NhaP-type Na+/H+ or K+/H+ antiporter